MLKATLRPLTLALSLSSPGASAQVQPLRGLAGHGGETSIAVDINASGQAVGTILLGEERRSFVYRDGKMLVHQAGKGLYLTNAINDKELVIGATYFSKRYAAATMHSNMAPVVPKGSQEFMFMMALVITTALGMVIYRRRYRGIALAGFLLLER
jgi:hypothetical protein